MRAKYLDTDDVKGGIEILKSLKEDLRNGYVGGGQSDSDYTPTKLITNLCERFYFVVRQLSFRHDKRPTLDVCDEYDVQDLFHALLYLHFPDVRAEEWTPTYAGKVSRMDFLLKKERIVVELKKTRPGLAAKELGSQLIEDIGRYKAHPACNTLICFAYDPDGLIPNPRGIENDLRRSGGDLVVEVLIRPWANGADAWDSLKPPVIIAFPRYLFTTVFIQRVSGNRSPAQRNHHRLLDCRPGGPYRHTVHSPNTGWRTKVWNRLQLGCRRHRCHL